MIDIKEQSQKLKDIVITSVVNRGDNYLCSGTLLGEWYKTILLEMDDVGSVLWRKTFGDDQVDYESQDSLAIDDGYLVCGASEGIASESGGQDWKAYILKTDEEGDKILYRSYDISGNNVAWSVVEDEDGFLLLGESEGGELNKIFVLKVDEEGNNRWKEELSSGKHVHTGGIVKTNGHYIIAGSTNQGEGWKNVLYKVDKNGSSIWDRLQDRGMTYDICSLNDQIYATGSKDDSLNLTCLYKNGERNWEKTFSEGCGLTILPQNGSLLIGGERDRGERRNPVLYKMDSEGEVKWKQDYEYEGWIETFVKTNRGYLLFIFGLEPQNHTRVMQVNNDGMPIW